MKSDLRDTIIFAVIFYFVMFCVYIRSQSPIDKRSTSGTTEVNKDLLKSNMVAEFRADHHTLAP